MPNRPTPYEAPDFTLKDSDGNQRSLAGYRGKWLVLYFYPKDETPGCTTEAYSLRDARDDIAALGAEIVGISRDDASSHEKFKAKMNFPFELLSDTDETVCNLFNVMKMKNMYGKQVRGIERSTFVFDAKGELRREWRGVKIPGHVTEVLEFVKTLSQATS